MVRVGSDVQVPSFLGIVTPKNNEQFKHMLRCKDYSVIGNETHSLLYSDQSQA
jgi:hypothetical protein